MIFACIDFETQGLNPLESRATEVGCVLINEHFEVIAEYEAFIWDKSYPPQTEEIVKLTHITDEMLSLEGLHPDVVFTSLTNLCEDHGVDAFIAHNAQFDRGFFLEEMRRVGQEYKAPWICTRSDMEHPETSKSRKLAHLALDYGVAVDPSKLHRASADVELMIAMMKASQISLIDLFRDSQIAKVIVRAVVPSPFGANNDGGVGKDKAKSLGFGWQIAPGTNGPSLKNCWLKQIKETEIENEEKKLGYKVVRVEI